MYTALLDKFRKQAIKRQAPVSKKERQAKYLTSCFLREQSHSVSCFYPIQVGSPLYYTQACKTARTMQQTSRLKMTKIFLLSNASQSFLFISLFVVVLRIPHRAINSPFIVPRKPLSCQVIALGLTLAFLSRGLEFLQPPAERAWLAHLATWPLAYQVAFCWCLGSHHIFHISSSCLYSSLQMHVRFCYSHIP